MLNEGRRAERKNEQDPNEIGETGVLETVRLVKKLRELKHRVLVAKR